MPWIGSTIFGEGGSSSGWISEGIGGGVMLNDELVLAIGVGCAAVVVGVDVGAVTDVEVGAVIDVEVSAGTAVVVGVAIAGGLKMGIVGVAGVGVSAGNLIAGRGLNKSPFFKRL